MKVQKPRYTVFAYAPGDGSFYRKDCAMDVTRTQALKMRSKLVKKYGDRMKIHFRVDGKTSRVFHTWLESDAPHTGDITTKYSVLAETVFI